METFLKNVVAVAGISVGVLIALVGVIVFALGRLPRPASFGTMRWVLLVYLVVAIIGLAGLGILSL